MIRRSRRAK